MAEVTLEGRAGTRLEPSRAGVGQAWGWIGVQVGRTGRGSAAALGLGWRGTLVMLSYFAARLQPWEAGVGAHNAERAESSATAFWDAWG